jgi:membrane fusion protein, multidrug efflux system
MIKKWAVTLLACAAIAAVLIGYKVLDNKAAEEAAASAPEYSETVSADEVARIEYQPAVSVLGKVVAPQQVELRNEVAGIVAAVNFKSGAQVGKGQLLLQLNISEEQAQLQSAIARAELARSTQKRIKKLRDSKTVSQDQYDKAVAELRVAKADKAMIEATIAKRTLRAPFDAVTGIHQFEIGQYLEENTLITTLVGVQDFLWIDFSLPQIYSTLPDNVSVVIASLSDGANTSSTGWTPLSAPVIARESVMKAESRSLRYRAQIKRGESGLLANAIVGVKVPIAEIQRELAIPAVAVLYSSAGPYVYLLNEDKTAAMQPAYRAQRQPVTLGDQQGELIIIKSGLEVGQRIASAGAFKLSDGLLTFLAIPKVESEKAAPEAVQ